MFAYCGNNPINKNDPTGHSFADFWDWLTEAIDDVNNTISTAYTEAWNWTKTAANDAWNWTKNAANDVGEWVSVRDHWRGILEVAGGAATVALSILSMCVPEPTMLTKVAGALGIGAGISVIILGVDDICQ